MPGLSGGGGMSPLGRRRRKPGLANYGAIALLTLSVLAVWNHQRVLAAQQRAAVEELHAALGAHKDELLGGLGEPIGGKAVAAVGLGAGLTLTYDEEEEEGEEGLDDDAEQGEEAVAPSGVRTAGDAPGLSVCRAVLPKHLLGPDGDIQLAGKLPVQRTAFVFQYDDHWRYAHMAMVERVYAPGGGDTHTMMAAWQAAPLVDPDMMGNMVMAVEGLKDQRILYSVSYNMGKTWTAALVAPTHTAGLGGGAGVGKPGLEHAVWSPVLHCDRTTGRMHLFYTESTACWRPTSPPTWEPGGDVRLLTLEGLHQGAGKALTWSTPRTLLEERTDGVPKVVANKLVVMQSGEWVLPYWREQPRNERVMGFTEFKSSCHTPTDGATAARTATGVLVSTDAGGSWRAWGNLTDSRTALIEGTVALLESQKLLMLLRTQTGCTFQSTSTDMGRTWGAAEPVALPNPNSKMHMIRLEPSGLLAAVINNHHRSAACRNCRTHLHVVVSRDGGGSWRNVATLEDTVEPNVRVHYPTLLQAGSMLYVVYSRFYLGRCHWQLTALQRAEQCPGLASLDQGIKMAEVDLSHLDSLPQMQLPADSLRAHPSKRQLYGMLHHFIKTEVPRNMDAMSSRDAAMGILLKLRQMKWKDLTSILALIYDLDFAGGARFLRANKGLGEMFKTVLSAQTGWLKERYNEVHGPVRESRGKGGRGRVMLDTTVAVNGRSEGVSLGGGATRATANGTALLLLSKLLEKQSPARTLPSL